MAVYKTDANLVSLWLLNNDVTDTKAANNLTAVNTPTYSSSDKKEGTHALSLDNTLFQRADITDGSQVGLDITGAISIGGWAKLVTGGANRTILGKYATSGNQRGYKLAWESATSQFTCVLSSNGTATAKAIGGTTISTGTWRHVCAVYNGTDLRIYVDGVLDSNGASNPLTYSSGIFNNTATFQLGARGDNSEYWGGLLDETFIFNRALSADEVLDIKTNGIQDLPAGRLVNYRQRPGGVIVPTRYYNN